MRWFILRGLIMTSTFARQGSPRTKWYLLLLILIVAVMIFYLTQDSEAPSDREQSTADNQALQNNAPEPGTGAVADSSLDPEGLSFAYCETLQRNTHVDSFAWGRDNFERWDRYLDEGYSLDEVTLVVEHFTNSNWAVSFHVDQLRKNTDVNQARIRQNIQIYDEYPEVFALGIRAGVEIPSSPLKEFAQKNPQERMDTLQEHGATVDDIAYFLHSELNEDDIILMLDYVADPFARVSLERLATVSLLDYAVANMRPRLVEALLHAGLRPTADSYLDSTMEWALRNLSSFPVDRQGKAAEIVLMLLPFDAAARFDVQNDSHVKGHLAKTFYEFDGESIDSIKQNHGIDLTQIPAREAPSIDPDHRLIRKLEAQRAEHLNAETVADQLDADLEACEQIIKAVNQQWQPQRRPQVVNSVIAEFEDSPEQIKRALAQIDPSLVDTFREDHEGRRARFSPVSMPQDMLNLLHQGKVEEVIEFYLNEELSDGNVNSLMWTLISWDVDHYEVLRDSGLLREPLEYFDMQVYSQLRADTIQQLERAGVEMRGVDSRQKTLLFYAVRRADIELVTFMEERGYPFSFDELGQDPLHAALDIASHNVNTDSVAEMVPILMEYRPVIDEFHLSRMALIQLKYPKTYRALVSQYPELEAPPGTELPQVR